MYVQAFMLAEENTFFTRSAAIRRDYYERRDTARFGPRYTRIAMIHSLLQRVNPLPTNDAPMRHDLSELSISLWEFIWGV